MILNSILFALTVGSVLTTGVASAESSDITPASVVGNNWKILGWEVDVARDRQVRSNTNAPQYHPSCPTGHYLKKDFCYWSPPKVIISRKGICPVKYEYKDKLCYLSGDLDPFHTFLSDGKWWQVDMEKDTMHRRKRGFSFYSTKCKLGYGIRDSKCEWFIPGLLKQISGACPRNYNKVGTKYCIWNEIRDAPDVFPYKYSLAAAQTIALERNNFDGLSGRKDQQNITSSPIKSFSTRREIDIHSSTLKSKSDSYTYNGQFKCTGMDKRLVQGTAVRVKIRNDIDTTKRFFEVCTFNNQGGVEYTGYTFSNQKREFDFTTHTGRSYQIRFWSDLGRCAGGVVSRSMSFQKSGQFTLRSMLNACV